MKRVIQFSGGITSWAAAKLVAEKYGTDDMVLLFADTLIEDEDLYRFLDDAAGNIGVPVTRIADGRTPLEVMRDAKIIGNSRIDPCSKILKRKFLDRWKKENCNPETDVIYFGIDASEKKRIDTLKLRMAPWDAQAPLCDRPDLTKIRVMEWAENEGLKIPRLYEYGFNHNNCGGCCIKAGQAQWSLVYRHFPERYLAWEKWENEMREKVGDHSILRDRSGGVSKPLTLSEFRHRITRQMPIDGNDWGGCGCALPA